MVKHVTGQLDAILCRLVAERVLLLDEIVDRGCALQVTFTNPLTGEVFATVSLDKLLSWSLHQVLDLAIAGTTDSRIFARVIAHGKDRPLSPNLKVWNPSWMPKQKSQRVKRASGRASLKRFLKPVQRIVEK